MRKDSLNQVAPLSVSETPSPPKELTNQLARITLAHDIRNPLTNINLAVGMLRSMPNTEHLKIYLDIINRASSQIEVLIQNLLIPSSMPPHQNLER